MTIKSFTMKWDDKEETVEYEDDIPFGDMEGIIRASVDFSNPTKPHVNLAEYRMQILQKVLRKAPFDYNSVAAIKKISRKKISQIISEVMKDYPLALSSADWMTSLIGSEAVSDLISESMPSALPDSDGQNKKPTDTIPSS